MPTSSYYSGGSASATEYTTYQELLSQMPDNDGNLINAVNIRNSVYTLWERIDSVQVIASQSASASSYYTNLEPTPLALGGVPIGSTFSGATMQQMFDLLLYPYIAPVPSISGGNNREFNSSNSVVLSWSVVKKSKSITNITVYGNVISPTGNNQSGLQTSTIPQNVNTALSVVVSDDGMVTSVSSSTSVNWLNAVYVGRTPTFAAPSMTIVGAKPAWADGAGAPYLPGYSGTVLTGKSKVLSSSRVGNYNGINGNGQYLVFAWPTSFGSPSFTVNGLPNTAWTKISSSISFTNMNGYVENYDIWISNTAQNSPIAGFVIS